MPSTALLFESKLVTFCSPTLLKMKAGNIFNISNEFNELEECLNYYNQLFITTNYAIKEEYTFRLFMKIIIQK